MSGNRSPDEGQSKGAGSQKDANPSSLPAVSGTEAKISVDEKEKGTRPDPTRYGDWEKNGRCIDF